MRMRMIFAAATLAALAAQGPATAQDGGYYRDPGRGHGDRDRHRDHGGPGPRATFFVKDDFQGRSITIDHEVRKFSTKDMDDKISSIGIDGGAWQVCEDDKFEGRCAIIDHSIARLSDIGWDDKISSARPVPPRGYGY